MLLTDVFIIDNLKVLEESKAKGTMKISGIFQRADEANNNKRVYSKALLEREVVKLADMIDNRRLLGELDHPSHDSVKLSNVSHLVTNLKMQGSEVLGEAELLNTPAGLTAQALIKGGVGIGISSRGLGTLSEGEDGTKNVNEDFKLVTFDLVADPSTRGAYPTLSESTETKEIYDRTMKQAISEKVFVQSLKDRLEEGAFTNLLRSEGPGRLKGKIRRGAQKVRTLLRPPANLSKNSGKGVPITPEMIIKAVDYKNSSKGKKPENSSTDFQIKYPNLSSLIETKANTEKRARRDRVSKLSPRRQGDLAAKIAWLRNRKQVDAGETPKKPSRDRQWTAYSRARKHADHKKHGKPGETPWETKKRVHGRPGGIPRLSPEKENRLAQAERESLNPGPSGRRR